MDRIVGRVSFVLRGDFGEFMVYGGSYALIYTVWRLYSLSSDMGFSLNQTERRVNRLI